MSTCQAFPTKTKAQAIEGFCDEFPGFCEVSPSGVESVPSDVEREILLDVVSTNDYNDCDGGFDFELACPTACGQPESTVSATYRVVADAFGGGKECPYHDGFVMERACPATDPCPADCSGGSWSYTCPNYCGYEGGYTTKVWAGGTPAVGDGEQCPSPTTTYCPAKTCCVENGDWTTVGGCGWYESGKQKYTQTYTGYCPAGTDTKYEPCAPCQYIKVLSKNKFCVTKDIGTYGFPSYKTYQVAVKAFKNVVDVPAVGTGTCPHASVGTETVDFLGCSGTVGSVDELTGQNYGEEPWRKSSSEMEAVVIANGGWDWPPGMG